MRVFLTRINDAMRQIIAVADAESFGPGKRKKVFAGDRRIAVVNEAGTLYAVDDTCTHVGGSLSEGSCENGIITYSWHGAEFRLCDGEGHGQPAYRGLTVYPVVVNDGVVEVTVSDVTDIANRD